MEPARRLEQAIREKRIIRLVYAGTGDREVEPHALCRTPRGEIVMLGFQRLGESRSGKSSGWKTFDVNQASNVEVLDRGFDPRSDYDRQGIRGILSVIVEVEP